ncbi:MAG: DUF6125 family protein [Smithellaceae bacterium]
MTKDSQDDIQEFKVDCSLEQYSKEDLISLIKLYSKLYLTLDGFWYLSVKNAAGNDTALKNDLWVWEKMHKREFNGVLETLKITTRDLSTYFKVLMLTLWMPQMGYDITFKDSRHAILTFKHCPTLTALEKEGEGREAQICGIVEPEYYANTAKLFNPKMKIVPIQVPPGKNREGFCCQWALSIEE